MPSRNTVYTAAPGNRGSIVVFSTLQMLAVKTNFQIILLMEESIWKPRFWYQLPQNAWQPIDFIDNQAILPYKVHEVRVQRHSFALCGEEGYLALYVIPHEIDMSLQFLLVASTFDGGVHFGGRTMVTANEKEPTRCSLRHYEDIAEALRVLGEGNARKVMSCTVCREQVKELVTRMRMDSLSLHGSRSIAISTDRSKGGGGGKELVSQARVLSFPRCEIFAHASYLQCPRCKSFSAFQKDLQLRSADEGNSRVIECELCGFFKVIG